MNILMTDFDWKVAPSHALISPKWTPNATSTTFMTGTEYVFYCNSVNHVFVSQSYTLSFKYSNGSVVPFGFAGTLSFKFLKVHLAIRKHAG